MRQCLFLLLFFTLITAPAKAAKEKPIVFKGDTVVSASIEIPESLSCTIAPGTTLKFNGYYSIIVKGVLIADGTAARPICITGEGRQRGSTERPCWAGMQIIGKNSSALLRHCRIEGAFKNIVWEARPLIDSCEFAGNHYALYCADKSAPHISSSHFYRNVYAIVADNATPLLLKNTISENTVGVHLQLAAQFVSGQNIIVNNESDIKADSTLGENNGAFSVHYLWDLMRQMY
ncbi:MAG: hypothetical protein PHC61_13555 [Chitinivibrionales bacterium]|nr:hypothetical protein [Chitinivibrionales bacterium]